jgi:glycosyltransferase involved in cell wall biosynthesis
LSKKKLSIFIDWYLPGTKAGGPVRSIYSLINSLKSEFDIYLITTNCDLGSSEAYKEIKADSWFEKEQVHYFYYSKDQLSKQHLTQLIQNLNSDVVYLNSFWSYWFSIFIIQLKNKGLVNCPIILAPRGMLGKGALSIKPLKKQAYLFLSKIKGFYNSVHFHATNDQEVNDIRSVYKNASVSMIQNFSSASAVSVEKEKKENTLKLFYLSRISPVKNLQFALEILGQIAPSYQITYDIYGNIEDVNYWEDCKKRIKKLPATIEVNYKGELDFYEIQQTISKYHFLFLPTLNENFGHSIVESLMSSCPIIISDQTPWNDVESNQAGSAIALDNQKGFIKAISEAAKLNQTNYNIRSKAALDYISKKINLNLITDTYVKLFNGTR